MKKATKRNQEIVAMQRDCGEVCPKCGQFVLVCNATPDTIEYRYCSICNIEFEIGEELELELIFN